MAAMCGIDWAAEWHDVRHRRRARTRLLAEQRFAHDEARHRRADRAAACRARVERVAHRAPRRAAGRAAAGGRDHACWRSIPTRSRPPAIASAPPPASPTASTRSCSASSRRTDQPPLPRAGAHPATRRSRCARSSAPARTSSPRASRWPTSCAPSSTPSGPARPGSSPTSTARSRSPSWQRYPSPTDARGLGTQAPRTPSWPATPTAAAGPPSQLLDAAAQRPDRRASANSRPTPAAAAVLGLVAALSPIVEQISQLTSEIRGAIRTPPRRPDLPVASSATPRASSAPPACWPRSATTAPATRPPTPSPPTPAKPPSPSNPANTAPPASAGPATNACRNHIGALADSTRHWHPWAHDIYQRARDRGCDHPHAIRILGRAWTRVLWRCWQDRVPYDPTRHRALTRHLTTKG